jgi:hypothetical protein
MIFVVHKQTHNSSSHTTPHHTIDSNKSLLFETMVFSAAAAVARHRIVVIAAHKTPSTLQWQRRAMASGPAPEWQGIDKVVRGVFPHDHQRKFSCFEIPNSLPFG